MLSLLLNGQGRRTVIVENTQPDTSTPRERIIEAAAQMLAEQGRHVLTTRAVATAAGAHAPTIYRQFGGMRGLLDAVASRGFDSYLDNNVARDRPIDPVDDLRSSWDAHIQFGLTHPALYALMFGDPATTIASTAADRAGEILAELISRIARTGQLGVNEENANAMVRAAGMGVVLQLLATPPEQRSLALSRSMREAVLASIITDPVDPSAPADGGKSGRTVTHAVALRSLLAADTASTRHDSVDLVDSTNPGKDSSARFTDAETGLLREWLDRFSD